ncbi:disks large-associated protein 5-like [Oncorhynchus keta]|uniref:disks large-associated protein 5-like n=1 Tax=Oncorhynchus keta TaxID=8018 RepID=UPI00227D0C2C|nr:disks large-associated protein 5-like [Oncorhynchus keta]
MAWWVLSSPCWPQTYVNSTTSTAGYQDAAVEERMKKLARYKEKELVKEKEKRAREKKGVFKVGLYRPEAQPLVPLPQAPAATIKARATTAVVQPQSTRVTRSTMRQQAPKVTFPLLSLHLFCTCLYVRFSVTLFSQELR